jgi:phosphate regulon transcriptional regulator PhoB
MGKERILVVEDEQNIRELIRYNLGQEGFRVETAGNGREGLDKARNSKADLILLDLMLPELDGFELCKILKQNKNTQQIPIIMLTAKGEETDRVVGLELGADDYIVKPFSPRELIARVKAVLRRVQSASQTVTYKAGTLELDKEKHRVTLKGKAVELTSKEFGLLQALMGAEGRLLSRVHLLEEVWDYATGIHIETRTVDMHIGQLRKKLKSEAERIVTVKNAGYRFDFDT